MAALGPMRWWLVAVLGAGTACDSDVRQRAEQLTGGDVERGRQAITSRGCASCHDIPGITTTRGKKNGPPLDGVSLRMYLAGRLEDTPANLMAWVSEPHKLDPKTPMPNTGVTAAEARDIAAYLYTLR